jgi:hypothetical protein
MFYSTLISSMALVHRAFMIIDTLLYELIASVFTAHRYFNTSGHGATTCVFVKSHNLTASTIKLRVVWAYLLGNVILAWAAIATVVNNTGIGNCYCFTHRVITWDIDLWTVIVSWEFTWEALVAILVKTFVAIVPHEQILVLFYTFWHWWWRYWLRDNTANAARLTNTFILVTHIITSTLPYLTNKSNNIVMHTISTTRNCCRSTRCRGTRCRGTRCSRSSTRCSRSSWGS